MFNYVLEKYSVSNNLTNQSGHIAYDQSLVDFCNNETF